MKCSVARADQRFARLLLSAALVLLAALATSAWRPALAQQGGGPVVFAAASLKNALDEASGAFAADTGKPAPRMSYAGTPALARQIEQGAPADLFIPADEDWMNYLEGKKLIRPGTRVDLLGNSIVIVAATSASIDLPQLSAQSLTGALHGGRMALADVNSVPAGRYAKTALETLGLWEALKGQLAQTENVRAALVFVARGEAPLGIVYRTDAIAEPRVKVVAALPQDSHRPIIYPAAVTSASRHPDANAFLAWLQGPRGRAIVETHGFVALAQTAR